MKYLFIIIISIIGFKTLAQSMEISISVTDKECNLGTASVFVISGNSPFQIEWHNGETGNSIDSLESGNYQVTIKDALNNDTTLSFSIANIECKPSPATHFTPNDDGYNDVWNILKTEYFPEFELFVYNRWGQLIHYQLDKYIPWDGKNQGIPLPDATYFYVLYFSKIDKSKFIKGEVSILR